MSLRAFAAALLVCLCPPLWAASEVIALHHRAADDMLEIARSVVAERGRVNAYGNQLVVSAPDAVIVELKNVLAELDKASRRLLVSVDTQEQGALSERGFAVDGSVRSGNVEVIGGAGEIAGRDQVRIIRRSTQGHNGGIQQVQVSEGYPALIQIGQSVPLATTGVDGYGQLYRETQYRDVVRGFYVTAQVNGDQVQVTLSSSNDRVDSYRRDVIHTQAADTRVTGRLGQWLTVGGLSESGEMQESGAVRRYSTQGAQDFSVRIKVEELP